ncbi:MAG: hypothetical protein Q9218_002572 [Villophora microphyllina]
MTQRFRGSREETEDRSVSLTALQGYVASLQVLNGPSGAARVKALQTVDSRDWVEETPVGQKKIPKPLGDPPHHTKHIPEVVESAWYSWWESQGFFKTRQDGSLKLKGTYAIAMPSLDVTCKIHVGHALALSLQDTLARWHRMRQFSTQYIPSYHHNGNATQEMNETTRRLGISADWSQEALTMDPPVSEAVFTKVFCPGFVLDRDGSRPSQLLGNVVDPIDILDGISIDSLYRKLLECNLSQKEVENGGNYLRKAFPQGISKKGRGADVLRFALIQHTQASCSYINFDATTLDYYGSYSIIWDGTPEEARSAKDTLYTTLESSLRLISPFMPFLSEELWQRLPRRPGDNTSSITIAKYPEYESCFDDPRSGTETAYKLILGCAKGIRTLMKQYGRHKPIVYIVPQDQMAYDTVSAQLSALKPLPRIRNDEERTKINILKPGEETPSSCAVFPVSADANVYLELKDHVQDTAKVKRRLDQARERMEVIKDYYEAKLSKKAIKDREGTLKNTLTGLRRTCAARLQASEENIKMLEKIV